MPTYGYRCTACSHEFERFQKITEPAITECENCGAAVKKILYPVGIAFKGTGFYVTDYKPSGESRSRKSGDSDSKESSGSDTGTGSDSKSDSGGKEAAPGSAATSSDSSSAKTESVSTSTSSTPSSPGAPANK